MLVGQLDNKVYVQKTPLCVDKVVLSEKLTLSDQIIWVCLR